MTDFLSDVLLIILAYLDPLSLYYLSRANKALMFHARSDVLWKMHALIHFPTEMAKLVNALPGHYYSFFTKTFNQVYQHCSANEKECFTLIRANDVYTIKKRRIDFNSNMLRKCNKNGDSLLSLIRGNNNRTLNEYVFNKIGENKSSYDESDLILAALQLDQDNQSVKNLLSKKNLNRIVIDNASILYLAVFHQSIHCVRLLLTLGIDPNVTFGELASPLYVASQHGSVEMVDLLLTKHANIDAVYKNKYTALYIAAQRGHRKVVEYLVTHDADINFSPDSMCFPLYIAAQEDKAEIVSYLLQHGADTTLRYKGFSPLYAGARNNRLNVVNALLLHYKKNQIKTDVNEISLDGSTPLYVAAQDGYTKMCQLLLENGASVESQFQGYTSLYIASQNGHFNVVEVLCRFKVNCNYISPNDSTALYAAAQNGYADIVKLLCDQNCDTEISYENNYTPLYVAAQKDHLLVAQILLEHGALVNCQTHRGATPLYVAAQKGYSSMVDLLLKNGADVNLCFSNGYTPLHIACAQHDIIICEPIITSLIRAGADPLARCFNDQTAGMLAENSENMGTRDVMMLLTEHPMAQLINIQPLYMSDTYSMINVLNNLIMNECITNKISLLQATTGRNLLEKTLTPFGYSVVLFALLHRDNPQQSVNSIFNKSDAGELLTKCIIHTLGFESKVTAKNSLYTMILSSLSYDQTLLTWVKKNIIDFLTECLNKHTEYVSRLYDKAMLCLNLIEVRINKLPVLTSEKNNSELRLLEIKRKI